MTDARQQCDPQARIEVREAIAYLRRLAHMCGGERCEHCLITKNLDRARRELWSMDPLGEIDHYSPWAGCPGNNSGNSSSGPAKNDS